MNKENVTKGVWTALKLNDGTYAIKDEESLSRGFSDRIAENICSESDADLICEAGTVFFESGLTPNELLLQRDLLLEVFKKINKLNAERERYSHPLFDESLSIILSDVLAQITSL